MCPRPSCLRQRCREQGAGVCSGAVSRARSPRGHVLSSLPWAVIDAHKCLFIGGLLLVIVFGVVGPTLVASRLRRRALAQKSGNTRGGPPAASAPG